MPVNASYEQIMPMKDRMLVQPVPEGSKTIILTDHITARKAMVLAVGPKVTECKVGDVVILPGIAAEDPDWQKENVMLIQEGDIGGIVTGGN